jgi:hypothetical protein
MSRPARRIVHAVLPLLLAGAVPGLGPVLAQDAEPVTRTAGLIRATWDYPTQASVGFGVIAAKLPANFRCKAACLYHGATIQAAAGIGGGELAVGYGSIVGDVGSGSWLLRHPYVSYGVRAAAVRTWGTTTLDPSGATYLGVEGGVTVAQFSLRMGVFRRTETVYGEKDWRVFGGLGWGF